MMPLTVFSDGIDAVAGQQAEPLMSLQATTMRNIEMKSKVEILGSGADVTTIDGSENGTVVTSIQVDDTAKLDGFTITNGHATNGGGIVLTLSSPALRQLRNRRKCRNCWRWYLSALIILHR